MDATPPKDSSMRAGTVTVLPGRLGARLWSRSSLVYFALLAVFLSVCYFSFGTYRNWPYKIESDGKYYYQYLVSGYYDRDFNFTNNYLVPAPPWMRQPIDIYDFRDRINPDTGRPTNIFTIGPAILWFPFFLVAHVIARGLGAVGIPVDVNPWGQFTQYAVMYSAVVYTLSALYIIHRLLLRYFEGRVATYATWLLLVSTNLFYYAVFEASMSHVYDLFTYALFLFVFIESTRTSQPLVYVYLGLAAALHVLVRTQNILSIALFSAALVATHLSSRSSGAWRRSTVAYGIALIIGLLPIPLLNAYLYGHPFAIPLGAAPLDLGNPRILQVLFSERNGLFSQHPALLLGMAGFLVFLYHAIKTGTRRESIFFGTMLVAFVGQLYINSAVADWWGGDAFGQRRLISSFPLFAFGLAYLLQRGQRSAPWLNVLAIIMFSIAGLYLTFIHVFLWDYSQPHNIWLWMFYYAPQEILKMPAVRILPGLLDPGNLMQTLRML